MAFEIKDIDESQAPLLEHLVELRGRLLKSIAALFVAFGICLYFVNPILAFLVQPLRDAAGTGGKLIYTKLYEAFFVDLKVALFAAFILAFPVISNQMWAFIAPGLYAKEKKAFLPFLIATPVLFLSGAALAYYVVMPTAFRWMLGFQGNRGGIQMEALPSVGDYLGLVMQFILAFGISFLLPVLLLLLNRAGIVTRQQLSSARRYVIVGITVLAAVLTPPDVGSQLMLAVPLMILFEGSLVVMWFGEKRAAKAEAQAEVQVEA
ncbi:sec-independent protein translocase protein TatC [Novosphingobium sp. SG751A]|uniref:twin-arginine translocase subunit TatC n=1 Tax=Novosphingobium sp. SG751A TaxID=2587000 RepID=UPI001553CE7C|nr:twin-arginine translocase subunit TatC [Novosphingobium sp. SG751A]NOW47215.1 sec-independent protein translocase protein TatC [Novosphingobium sp. SG751A]